MGAMKKEQGVPDNRQAQGMVEKSEDFEDMGNQSSIIKHPDHQFKGQTARLGGVTDSKASLGHHGTP